MTETDGVWHPSPPFDKNKIQWPLSYSITTPTPDRPPRRWWNHHYYRGPRGQSVRILYSSSKSQSELIAQEFLNEPVLGFDMEWPWDAHKRTESKVSLIQLACEHKVALFHIALHDGQTTEDLIAPSLRRIIESASILKTGVAIMCADFRRLRDDFQLEPRGAFELSHIHHLVTFGSSDPKRVISKLCALSAQTEAHLGLPLYKGSVRTSDWSLPLSNDQKFYAANDAYAAYMLFHCMNAKRLKMTPVPPLPKLAESYLPFSMAKIIPVQLECLMDGSKPAVLTAEDFYRVNRPEGVQGVSANVVATNLIRELLARRRGPNKSQLSEPQDVCKQKEDACGDGRLDVAAQCATEHVEKKPHKEALNLRPTAPDLDSNHVGSGEREPSNSALSEELYKRLVEHRKSQAAAKGLSAFMIAHNSLLKTLVRERPSNRRELLRVRGVGEGKATEYGPDWLRIIADFESEHGIKSSEPLIPDTPKMSYPTENIQQPQPSDIPSKRRIIRSVGNSKEIVLAKPSLSTGLSFTFSETRLDVDEAAVEGNDENQDQPGDLLAPEELIAPGTSPHRKRKRADSFSDPREEIRPQSPPKTDLMSAPLPVEEAQPPKPLSWEQKLLRKKLDAYVKSVIWAMDPKPAEPIVSEQTLQSLVETLPQTLDEFHQVPGVQEFIQVCESVKKDLWLTFYTWTRVPGLTRSS